MFSMHTLLGLSLWAIKAAASVDQTTNNTCLQIEKTLSGMLHFPGSKAYIDETKDYWSQAMMDKRPACIALPISSQGVSMVVKILNEQPAVKFAVKSGGHSPNPDFASTSDGILLSLANMKGATYDSEKDVAYVLPGGKWKDVISPLAPLKKTVVGGRLDIVGVGGYLTGGGLSFLSAQYGMAADTITNFETVMANGSIVNVNAETNKELLVAMRGGGNQFGIVTKFTMKAIPIDKVWGGPIMFSAGKVDALLDAFHDFTESPADPKAAVILTLERIGGQELWILYRCYDGPTPPSGAFKKFESISNVPGTNFGATRTYPELLSITAFRGDSLPYGRMSFRMMTLPLLSGGEGVAAIKDAYTTWITETKKFQSDNFASVASFALQSFPSLIGKATAKTEGNALGLGANDGPRWMIGMTTVANGQKTDEPVWATTRNVVSGIEKSMKMKIENVKAKSGEGAAGEVYNPMFLNDAAFDQDIYSTYKNFEKFKALQKEVDPNGLWSGQRTGGFKFK